MTDIREHIERSLSERREGGASLQTSGIFLSMSAILELYEKLDKLEKRTLLIGKAVSLVRLPRSDAEWQEALDNVATLAASDKTLDLAGAILGLVHMLRGEEPKPKHEPCVCGGRPVLGYCYPGQSECQAGCGDKCGWCGAEGETDAEAWENWDRVMRAAREK